MPILATPPQPSWHYADIFLGPPPPSWQSATLEKMSIRKNFSPPQKNVQTPLNKIVETPN